MDVHSNVSRSNYLNSLVSRDVIDEFGQHNTHQEQFQFAFKLVVRHSGLLFDSGCQERCSDCSRKSREEGNKCFIENKFYKAIQKYTESIIYAVDSSEELALAYANRSAALFKVEKYEHCVDDIIRAQNLNYPDRLKSKLYKRKGMCLKALGRPDADLAFLEAIVWVGKSGMSRNEINRSKIELKQLMSGACTVAKPKAKPELLPPPKILVPNPKIPSVSDAVEIAYSKKYGRHLIANRKIKPGEVLVVEKPFCKRLLPQNIHTHCSNCWLPSWAMIPCKSCVNVAYCSDACKDEAWDSYHEVECAVIGFLLCFELNDDILLTMRMAIIATQKGKKIGALKQELMRIDQNTDPCTMGSDKDGIFHSDNYRSIYCSKFGGGKEWVTKRLLSATISIAMVMCMLVRESKMFGENLALHETLKNPDVLLVGGLMVKHMHYTATIKTHRFGGTHGQDPHQYGHALMAVSSLLNHSCDANTTRQFLRDGVAIHAIYPIEQNEQIFDNYFTLPYAVIPKKVRQARFKEWKFDCECLPCTKSWPTMEHIPSFENQPLTRTVKTKLAQLPIESIVMDFTKQLRTDTYSMTTVNKLNHMVEIIHKLARKPCRELMMVVMMLKSVYDITILNYEPADQQEIDLLQSINLRNQNLFR